LFHALVGFNAENFTALLLGDATLFADSNCYVELYILSAIQMLVMMLNFSHGRFGVNKKFTVKCQLQTFVTTLLVTRTYHKQSRRYFDAMLQFIG